MALRATGRDPGNSEGRVRNAALPRSSTEHLSILLERFLRLVYRMDQAGADWPGSRTGGYRLAESFCSVRSGTAPVASRDAVSDRGALASIAAAPGSEI